MCCQQSSWVLPESQTNGSALWWLSNGRDLGEEVSSEKYSSQPWDETQSDESIHLKIFNKASTSFRRASHALGCGGSSRWWISHHALGTGEEFSLQALEEWWASTQLLQKGAGTRKYIMQREINKRGKLCSSVKIYKSAVTHRRCFSHYLQSAELLSFIAGNLCVDEFGQEEFSQLWVLQDSTHKVNWQSVWLPWRADAVKATFTVWLIEAMWQNIQTEQDKKEKARRQGTLDKTPFRCRQSESSLLKHRGY